MNNTGLFVFLLDSAGGLLNLFQEYVIRDFLLLKNMSNAACGKA